MKKLIIGISVVAILAGCTTNSQRTAYNTIATVEQTATVAVDDYYTLVIQGKISTNNVPVISKAFNLFQQAAQLAALTTENGTNALAPGNIVLEASQLGTLITTIESQK